MKAQEYVRHLMAQTLPGYKGIGAPEMRTCGGLLCGDPDREITRVATTFIVTVEVLREAIRRGVDLIISHEPLFCHTSGAGMGFLMPEGNAWDAEKLVLIEESGIAVMRFHDGMHAARPDLIYRGWMAEFGWEEYSLPGPNQHFFQIPPTTMGEVAAQMKDKLHMNGIRAFGDPAQPVSRVGVLVGGGSQGLGNPMMPMNSIVEQKLDLLICGEIMELMLPYFAADASALGHPVTMLVAGHNRTEEVGMKHLPTWLKKVTPEVEAVFIEAGDPLYML